MDRVTHRLPEQHVEQMDELVDAGIFPNRSEMMRAAVRQLLYDCPEVEDDIATIDPDLERAKRRVRGDD